MKLLNWLIPAQNSLVHFQNQNACNSSRIFFQRLHMMKTSMIVIVVRHSTKVHVIDKIQQNVLFSFIYTAVAHNISVHFPITT